MSASTAQIIDIRTANDPSHLFNSAIDELAYNRSLIDGA